MKSNCQIKNNYNVIVNVHEPLFTGSESSIQQWLKFSKLIINKFLQSLT